ncbi:DUF2264 domain-containing protein [Kitasatospora aureofaciens]|uniref:DUF2264 domain-containing protein n=1 Tax=Kitasatospora aureofaciens TaxID=1894 RepID=UPI001C45047C|nr:DUF2264 domain-containing protein [Kitasatospora aureofaciens]MBV6701809.1 DUF2264 domain-containing protein [Kitasatospora aureofaciens]
MRGRPTPGLKLPPEDRGSAPVTGWTRRHWIAVADHLLASLRPYRSPLGARISPPGRGSWSGADTDGLEGFARTAVLAALRLAAGDEPAHGGLDDLDELAGQVTAGLLAGTDPRGPECWPAVTDYSQQIVEAASIAVALHESRPWIWDRLTSGQREQVARWLGGTVGRGVRENNHVLFQAVVGEFLASVGAGHDRAEIESRLEQIEPWYTGDGWYLDGPEIRHDYRSGGPGEYAVGPAAAYDAGRRFDHYNAWGLHLYPLLWARIAGERAGARAALYRERLNRFLAQYRLLFGPDGAVLHQGRSLSYRFACLAPFWLGVLDDATPLTAGQTRRLASGVLRHFTERGAPDPRGLLPLGWYGEQDVVAQVYSSPGSPYAAAMGFLGLLLPAGHPVWTAPEERLARERADVTAALPAPGFLVHRTAADGIVRVLNHGSCYLTAPPAVERDDPHYARLAYSTRTGPLIGAGSGPGEYTVGQADALRIDNHLALLLPDGTATRRERIHPLALTDRYAASWHRPLPPGEPVPGALPPPVVSVSVPAGPWEIRVHGLCRPPGWGVREGGYALAAEDEPEELPDAVPGPRAAVRAAPGAHGPGLVSAVVGLHGWAAAEVRRSVRANAFGHCSAVPLLVLQPASAKGFDGASEEVIVVVSAVLLTGAPGAPTVPDVTVRVDGAEVCLTWPDGRKLLVSPVLPWHAPVDRD